MFTKTLTAGVLAISLALTSLTPNSASAEISGEDALTGLLALLLFGAAVHELRDRNDHTVTPAPQPSAQRWRDLPEQCQRRVTRRNGNRINYFAQRCLNNNYRFMNRLPDQCHVQFRTSEGQRRQGFRTRCLREAGFRINRH